MGSLHPDGQIDRPYIGYGLIQAVCLYSSLTAFHDISSELL